MATRQQTMSRQTAYRQAASYRNGYVYGNTARQFDVKRAMEEEPNRQLSVTTRKNREKAVYMNFAYVMFLVVAMMASAMILLYYIQLQSMITNSNENIARLERNYNDLRLENDEEYSRITSSIDFEEIRRIAIGELGMTYATEGQIINYSNEGSNYVKQMAEIPQ